MMFPEEASKPGINRRNFIGSALGSAAAGTILSTLIARAEEAPAEPANVLPPPNITRKVKVGILGGGHRGNFLAGIIRQHGGYDIHAVADYFPEIADKFGGSLGVDKARRFSGLSGYKKVLASGVEALVILDVPCFYPEQAKAAVDAGCHVYVAKPVAVDVPGTMLIGELGKEATKKNLCFLVDYQLPYDPAVAEVIKRIQEGALGPLAHVLSYGDFEHTWPDPPKTATIASRLREHVWMSDIALGGDTIVNYDIHIIDALMVTLGKRPVSAMGASRICRPDPHGDRMDACGLVYEMDDGLMWTHVTQALKDSADLGDLRAAVFGVTASAQFGYFAGKVYVHGGPKQYVGKVSNTIYPDGAKKNVADFYRNITGGHYENITVPRAVDGTLTAILGREAAIRRTKLTMDELIKENKKLEIDVTGLDV